MSREIFSRKVFLSFFTYFFVSTIFVDAQGVDSVDVKNDAHSITPFNWEVEWGLWCDSQTCVSSDTGLWNIMGEPELELDTAIMKSRMAILDWTRPSAGV